MSKTVSCRLPKEIHDELLERCNRSGCTINDFIKASIEFAMNGSTDFDFGEFEDDKPKENLELDHGTIYDEDGNKIGILKGFESKPTITISDV